MENKAIIENIEFRSSFKDKIKRYFVKGQATFKGLDTYNTELSPAARKKVGNQLKNKDIKVGIQHQKALNNKVMTKLIQLKEQMLAEGRPTKLIDDALMYQQNNNYPLGKPKSVDVTEDAVDVEIGINPYLETLDPEYYNSVIGMLKEGFLDGFSIEFANPKTHVEHDVKGVRKTIIDDLDLIGLEFVSNASNNGARIAEVLVRMAGVEENKMEDEKLVKENEELKEKMASLTKEKETVVSELEAAKKLATKVKEPTPTNEPVDELKALKEELSEMKELLSALNAKGNAPSAKGLVAPEGRESGERTNAELETYAAEKLDKLSIAELLQEKSKYNL